QSASRGIAVAGQNSVAPPLALGEIFSSKSDRQRRCSISSLLESVGDGGERVFGQAALVLDPGETLFLQSKLQFAVGNDSRGGVVAVMYSNYCCGHGLLASVCLRCSVRKGTRGRAQEMLAAVLFTTPISRPLNSSRTTSFNVSATRPIC